MSNHENQFNHTESMDMLLNTLSQDSFLMISKALMETIGLSAAAVYSEMLSRYKYFAFKGQLKTFRNANAPIGQLFFYATVDSLASKFKFSYKGQQNVLKELIALDLLYVHKAGCPSLNYYSFNTKTAFMYMKKTIKYDDRSSLADLAELDCYFPLTNNNKKINNNNKESNKEENKNKEIFNEDLELEFDLASESNLEDSFLLRDDKLVEPKISVGKETELGANSPEFAYTIKDENGKVIKQSNNPYKVLTKKEADLEKGFVSDLINDYYPIDEMYLPIQDNAANERFRAKYPPLYPEFGNHMNIYQSCLRDFPKNEAKAQVLFEQLYHDKIDWSRVRSKQGMLPTQKEDIDIDFLMNMDYSTSATLTYFGIKYEKTGPNKERPVMKYKEIWVPIYPYSYLEKLAPTRLRAFLNTASNVPSYYQVLVGLIKDKEKKNGK